MPEKLDFPAFILMTIKKENPSGDLTAFSQRKTKISCIFYLNPYMICDIINIHERNCSDIISRRFVT